MKELDEQPFQLEKGTSIINGKYTVVGKIGTGSHSTVHAILMMKGLKQIVRAIKVESSKVKEPQISTEISVLKSIQESCPEEVGFAKTYEYGYQQKYHYAVMTLLGPNLEQLLKLCGGTFSMKTTLMLALQMLDKLQILHNLGYIYGDVKPDNFLVGLGSQSPFLFMVDFGHCKRYKNKVTGQHILYKENASYTSNPIFASINSHNNIQASRRDDIESFLYVVTYLRLGKLPWAKTTDAKRNKSELNIGQIKKRVTPQMLCHKLPIEVIDLVYYVRSLEFYQKPDYSYIRKMFYACLEREQFDATIMYDWNKLEQIDFKVYSDEPKIILKGQAASKEKDEIVERNQNQQGQREMSSLGIGQDESCQLFEK